ncbi:MAG: zf-HC2 domain-containing protein [Eubacteriales bacterium]|jgi:predicted anti-sigma-YlaC factor YlaD|uniref:zf-HC2 domain-containing protein n=1 Tax=Syntrophomonas wolfei TaxID=863 RepID=UPI000773292E|nr:zf-HC2 domain-containing protein [Syntrophomonas wolfei]MDD4390432.1 zf-HC2 domain-containing protein [Eubacteriales bacterium]
MKVSCEIIKDLLPLYHDGVCSNDSKTMVEEHLAYCDSCKAALLEMDDTLCINKAEQNLQEAEVVKKLSKRWKKGMLKSLLEGMLFTILAIALIALVLYFFIGFRIIPKPY